MTATKPSTSKKVRFDPASFEGEVASTWYSENTYRMMRDGDREKKYVLSMFPYPSGEGLHTGHARIYVGTDILARYYRMQGNNVLNPMGWDAFGLPAENYAIKTKTNPKENVPRNIENFKRQCQSLGLSNDWEKELSTTDPEYYALTQWLFITFFKHGLLYKKDIPVFYCPFCKTGLALEEVENDGTHERCGNEVEKRNLPQWIFRIREYADSLLKGLDGLDWPSGIMEMQKNWIGKKEGINITYKVEGTDETLTCFTTRPDTNFGATFIVIAPEHPFAQALLEGNIEPGDGASKEDIKKYISESVRKSERERMAEEKTKTGVFTGYYANNTLNGKKLPVWISDFVLVNVGTGAVVGVPAHDKRDYEFAAKFDIEIKRVVESPDGDRSEITNIDQVQESAGKMMDSEFLNDMDIQSATMAMMDHMEKEGYGERTTSFHLRDWIFSRQRYWGEPIPMVYCESCAKNHVSFWSSKNVEKGVLRLDKGPDRKTFQSLVDDIEDKMYGWFPLSRKDLPLELPDVESYEPSETGESPLAQMTEWTTVTCPECGGEATRETDTMPNWAGSNWYFMAFPIAEKIYSGTALDEENPFEGMSNDTMPVDWYVGGAEHAVLHLLYARFWVHALCDLGLAKVREPFASLRNVGMVQAEDGRKMSKSLGNVVNPDDIIEEFGADALRVYAMFMAPFGQEIAWSTQTLQGSYRFVKRIWQIYNSSDKLAKNDEKSTEQLASELQKIIKKITLDIPDVKFNTPISSMMEFLNLWEKQGNILSQGHAKDFLKLLAPYAPFITEHIWKTVFNEQESIHVSEWPVVDVSLILSSKIKMPVQVSGKVRDFIEVSADVSEDEALEKALTSEKIQKWIDGKSYKTIFVPGKIMNIVLE